MKDLDIVICTKDRPRDLARCLDSIGAQTRAPARVLVVDAGQVPVGQTEIGVPVAIIRAQPGLPRQRNAGLRASTSSLVAFLDDDVELAPNYVDCVATWFDEHPAAAGVSATTPGDDRRPWLSKLYRRLFDLANDDGRLRASGDVAYLRHPSKPTRVDVLPGHNMVYRRRSIRGMTFDSTLETYGGEDADFALRASLRGEMWMLTETSVIHHHSPTSRVPQQEFVRQVLAASAYLFAKNKPLFHLRTSSYARRLAGRVMAYHVLSVAGASWGPARGAWAGLLAVPGELARGCRMRE